MKSDKQLYFIAIVPPEPAFSEIKDLKQYMADNYSSDAALRSPAHITLHMPFQWKTEKEEKLFNVLNDFASKGHPIKIKLNNFDCFEPRVIFVKVEQNAVLNKMQSALMDHAKINLNLFNANYRQQPFHPHVTIAFRNLKKTIFPEAWRAFQNKQYASEFLADSFCLLKHDGKRWNVYKEFKLKR